MADYEEISGKGIIFGDNVTTKRIADGTEATVKKEIYISGTGIANDVSLDVGTLSGGYFGENCRITANQEPQTRYNVVEVGSIGNNSTISAQNIRVRGLSNSVIGRGANLQAKHRIYVEDRIRDKATLKAEEIIVKGAIVGSGAQLEADEKISVGTSTVIEKGAMLKTPHLDISTQSEAIMNTAGNPITLVADAVYIPRELLDAVPNIIVDGISIKENSIETTNYEAAAQLLSSSTRLVAACTAYGDTHHNDVEAAKSVVKAKRELLHEEMYGEASPDEAKQEKDFHPLRHLLNRGEGWLGRVLGSASDNHSGTQGKNKRGSDRGGRS